MYLCCYDDCHQWHHFDGKIFYNKYGFIHCLVIISLNFFFVSIFIFFFLFRIFYRLFSFCNFYVFSFVCRNKSSVWIDSKRRQYKIKKRWTERLSLSERKPDWLPFARRKSVVDAKRKLKIWKMRPIKLRLDKTKTRDGKQTLITTICREMLSFSSDSDLDEMLSSLGVAPVAEVLSSLSSVNSMASDQSTTATPENSLQPASLNSSA